MQIYDPTIKTFIAHPESDEVDQIVDVAGPFSYFLSTINVDRLEPVFTITPLARTMPIGDATCELVLVRPLRDPSIFVDSTESRTSFAPKLWAVMDAVYQNGTHIDLRYAPGGEVTSSGDGAVVVEYIRCGGWEWVPVSWYQIIYRISKKKHYFRMTRTRMHIFCAQTAPYLALKGVAGLCVLRQHPMVFDLRYVHDQSVRVIKRWDVDKRIAKQK